MHRYIHVSIGTPTVMSSGGFKALSFSSELEKEMLCLLKMDVEKGGQCHLPDGLD